MNNQYKKPCDAQYSSNIILIRAVEDKIRATRKYKEYIRTIQHKHPIQGVELPSAVFRKDYEVYPDTEISWDMPAGQAIDWLWGDVPIVDVLFTYDYRTNNASIIVRNGAGAVEELARAIPGFSNALAKAIAGRNGQ